MYPDLLERVKRILEFKFFVEHDEILNEFIDSFATMVNLYIQTDALPIELEFVVVESTVARYRRIGSEGFESEGIGEMNVTYQEILTPYYQFMDNYKNLNNKNRFL